MTTTDKEAYPDNVLWEPSPFGYYYNDGSPEKVRQLQAYMVERGLWCCATPTTPKDPSWTDEITGASFK